MNRAKVLAILAAALTASITIRVDYNAAEDELQIRVRKVKPLLAALNARTEAKV